MIYLSGAPRLGIELREGLGLMVTPAIGVRTERLRGALWAADTECFARGERFSLERYLDWLVRLDEARPSCLFATAPDVLGDAGATWQRSEPVFDQLRALGYPPALVAQNGFDADAVDWAAFDALFLGGDDVFKLGPAGAAAATEAKARGKWLHMGRVNSRRRLLIARVLGCQSADGTYVKFGPDRNLPRLARWVREAGAQGVMPL